MVERDRYRLGDGTLTPRSTDHTGSGIDGFTRIGNGKVADIQLPITTCGNSFTIGHSDVAPKSDPVSGAPRSNAQTHLHSTRPVNPPPTAQRPPPAPPPLPSNSPSIPHILSPNTSQRAVMGRTRSTAIRSGPKLSQPSASASSPMTDIEAAYKHVYDDLDKRKTHKGWQQRKMRWVKGHKVLKELLVSFCHHKHPKHTFNPTCGSIEATGRSLTFEQQDPALPGSKASEWSAWSQEEVSRDRT